MFFLTITGIVFLLWLEYLLTFHYSKEISLAEFITDQTPNSLYTHQNKMQKHCDIVGVFLLILVGLIGSIYILSQSI